MLLSLLFNSFLNPFWSVRFMADTDAGGAEPPEGNEPDGEGVDAPDPELLQGVDPDKPVPYERFREVISDNQELKVELRKLQAWRERLELEEQRKRREQEEQSKSQKMAEGQWKDLYNETQRELEEARRDAEQARLSAMRAKVGSKVGLPAYFIDRLMGETEEEMELDAQRIFEFLPKRSAVADGARGLTQPEQMKPTEDQTKARKRGSSRIYQEPL